MEMDGHMYCYSFVGSSLLIAVSCSTGLLLDRVAGFERQVREETLPLCRLFPPQVSFIFLDDAPKFIS